MRFFTILIFSLFISISTVCVGETTKHSYKATSILSSGKWIKIKVKETGVYKITYEKLLEWGFSNPANIQVYGYGGWPLDEDFRNSRIDDLPQVSTWVEKGADNIFNAGDYILFYARGTIKWEYKSGEFIHTNNPYSVYSYYFITESESPTKQMNLKQGSSSFTQEITSFSDYMVHEKELVNIGRFGREFYGEDFSINTSQSFTFFTPGINNNTGKVTVNFISKNDGASVPLTVKINEYTFSGSISKTTDSSTDLAMEGTVASNWTGAKPETNTVNLTYGAAGRSNTRLNYIRLNFDRELKFYDKSFLAFRSINAVGRVIKYTISNSNSNVRIWNVSDVSNIQQMEDSFLDNKTSFNLNSTSLEEFVAVDVKGNFLEPEFEEVITTQNLHALPQTDMIIITHLDFNTQADRIAEWHRTHDNLRVHVVTSDQIYNEFSSGTPDASAYRWFMKMFYDRGKNLGNESELPKYLLLIGDGVFDNRQLLAEWVNYPKSDYLLTYQSQNSTSTVNTYVTDDYFGFLDDSNTTEMKKNKLNIGVGRFPVKSLQEAKNVVDKTINYAKNDKLGAWKNNLCFIANAGDEQLHMMQADSVARNFVEKGNKEYVVNKIYIGTFKRDESASGCLYPDARKKFFNLFDSGTLILNFTGHGNVSSFGDNRFFVKTDPLGLKNEKLPFFITATCEFSRFDDFTNVAGEEMLLNPNGGVIGLFSTTRTVNSTPNFKINKAISNNLFRKDATGKYLRLGDIMRLAKNTSSPSDMNLSEDLNKLNFILLGDPALTLAYPEYKAAITKINGANVDGQVNTIASGVTVNMSGIITAPSGVQASDFSGEVFFNVYDSKLWMDQIIAERTVNQQIIKDITNIYEQSKILFSGRVPVVNGTFSLSFTMPKDINYTNELGRINIYAVNNSKNIEAQGYFDGFKIGGSDNTIAFNDDVAPVINSLYIGNSNFSDGDRVKDQSEFVVEVEDNGSGINALGSGIGRNVTLTIDNSPSQIYILNSYFEGDLNNSKKGLFRFTLPSLSAGNHTLKFKVWDIMNNSTTKEVSFVVKQKSSSSFDLTAVPDLMNKSVTFFVETNTVEKNLKVNVEVYNLDGNVVWKNEQDVNASIIKSFPIRWDMTNNGGSNLSSGIYTYKATIYSDDNAYSTEIKRFIVK